MEREDDGARKEEREKAMNKSDERRGSGNGRQGITEEMKE